MYKIWNICKHCFFNCRKNANWLEQRLNFASFYFFQFYFHLYQREEAQTPYSFTMIFYSTNWIVIQWEARERSGSVLDLRPRGRGLEPHRRHCVLCPWAKHIDPSLVLVQPRKTRPYITERLLMGRKESNQTKTMRNNIFIHFLFNWLRTTSNELRYVFSRCGQYVKFSSLWNT